MRVPVARSVLSERGWLAATPASFRDAVLDRCELHCFESGKTVYCRDDPPGGLWGLAAGGIAIEITALDHGALFGHFAGPGYWIGAAPTVMRNTRHVGIVTTRPSALMHLSMTAFEEIAAMDSDTWRWLAVLPIQQAVLATGLASDLMIRDPRRRVMAILLRLAGRRGPFVVSEPQEIVASQEEIAGIVNLSRTALGNMLRGFEKERLLERRYRRISVDSERCLAFLGTSV